MPKPTRLIHSLILAGSVTAATQPLAAKTAQECVDGVIKDCTAALADANWIQKIAIGDLCTIKLAACYVSYS